MESLAPTFSSRPAFNKISFSFSKNQWIVLARPHGSSWYSCQGGSQTDLRVSATSKRCQNCVHDLLGFPWSSTGVGKHFLQSSSFEAFKRLLKEWIRNNHVCKHEETFLSPLAPFILSHFTAVASSFWTQSQIVLVTLWAMLGMSCYNCVLILCMTCYFFPSFYPSFHFVVFCMLYCKHQPAKGDYRNRTN